jgi:hypothetical protein
MFAAKFRSSTGRKYHLTVESMAGRQWEWVAWEQGKAACAQHGACRSVLLAMQNAEAAIAALAQRRDEGDG